MTQPNTSQVHNAEPTAGSDADHSNPDSPWDPTGPFRVGFDLWSRLATDQIVRMQSLCDELVDAENEAYERVRRTGREFANMAEKTVTYAANLTTEWQSLAVEAARKSREMWSAAKPR